MTGDLFYRHLNLPPPKPPPHPPTHSPPPPLRLGSKAVTLIAESFTSNWTWRHNWKRAADAGSSCRWN